MPPIQKRESAHDVRKAPALECKVLIEVAGRELFHDNAFRVTGLPASASGREVTKHGDRLKLQEELGNDEPPVTGAFVREPPPSLDEIRTALQRLKSPERRIVDEFFWFWPMPTSNGAGDAALDAVQQGQADKAISIWRGLETDDQNAVVALHNLAVAYHIAALDRENSTVGHGCTEERRAKIARFWQSAIKRWLKIADDDRLWDLVAERIRQLNEPNLPTGFSRQIRQNLRVALCKIHAELGLAYLESAQAGYAQSQFALFKQLAQETGADGIAAEIVLRPITTRLRQQLDLALQKASANASGGAEAARELLGLARRMSSNFELLLAPDHPARADLYDDIADAINRIQITYHKKTEDDPTCLEILQQALPYATTLEIKDRIEGNIRTLKSNISYTKLAPAYALLKTIREGKDSPFERLELFRRKASPLLTFVTSELAAADPARDQLWDAAAAALRELSVEFWNASQDIANAEAAIGMAMQFVRTTETRKQLLADQKHLTDIRAQRIAAAAARKLAEEKASRKRLIGWLVAGGVVVLIIIAANSDPKPRSSYTPRSYTPPATSYASGTGNTYRVPSYASAELDRDRQSIESNRTAVTLLQSQVEALGSQIERERPYVDNTSQFAIDAFNRKVNDYNTLLQRAQTQQAAFNQMVDSYNAKLQNYGR